MLSLSEYQESVRSIMNIIPLIYTEAFKREMDRFVNPTGPVSKQIACDNIIQMTEKAKCSIKFSQ